MVSNSSTPGASPGRPGGSARRILCPPRAPLPRQIRSASRPQVIPVQRSRLKPPGGGQHDGLKPSVSQFSRGWTRHSRLIATTIAVWVAAQTVGTKYRVRLIGREAPRSFRWALAHDENVAGQVPQGLAQIVRPSVVRIRFEHQQTAVELYHPLPQGCRIARKGLGLRAQCMPFEQPRNPRPA
jgi:hypothetical protein